jgi:hypothetical protein
VADASGRCACCNGTTKLMFVHEEWSYDDEAGIATVVGLSLICQDCNSVTHFGRLPGEYYEAAVVHLAAVNGITRNEAEALMNAAMDVWGRRSRRDWRVAVSPAVVEHYADMAALPERAAAVRS